MDREDAIDYLKNKDRIEGKETFSKIEEEKIKKVMKSGKIYGDPEVTLTY